MGFSTVKVKRTRIYCFSFCFSLLILFSWDINWAWVIGMILKAINYIGFEGD